VGYLYTWKTVALPLGTIYDFPSRGAEQTSIAGATKTSLKCS
jgi:hypothetical protein